MNTRKSLLSIIVLLLTGCSDSVDPGESAEAAELLSFNWDIRPIISDNCFACHGPDAEGGQKAGLRLDLFETAVGELPESPGKFAIVPGNPDSSELIRRIMSSDPDVVMPPPDTNKTLSTEEQQLLSNWIEQGAEYERHWAYVPVSRPSVPGNSVEGADAGAIDTYIGARLEQEGLSLSTKADKATLINRVTLDLTGLPPTLEAVDAFVGNTSTTAFEHLVDELLSSPEHAEHMAAQWLDIARWADSDGYLEDAGDRLLHPWRDWVIDAYQDNMPYDEFLTWQIAGDLFPNASREQILATTFLRLGQRSSENGIIPEEYENEYAIDRVETLGVGILGHTVGCARCHDHKYDPISIRDFYAFAGFFGKTLENGFYSPGGSIPTAGFVGAESGASLVLPDAETETRLQALEEELGSLQLSYNNVRSMTQATMSGIGLPNKSQAWSEITSALDDALAAHYAFERVYEGDLEFAKIEIYGRQEQGQPLAVSRNMPAGIREDLVQLSPSEIPGQVPAVIQSPIIGEGIRGNAFVFDEQNKGYFGEDVGDYDRTDAFTLDFWIRFADVYENATVLNHNQHIRFAGMGYTLDVENNHLRFDLQHTRDNKISVLSNEAVSPGGWSHITVTYDGSSQAQGVTIFLDGLPMEVEILADNLTQTIISEPLAFIDDTIYGLGFGKRWQQYTLAGSHLDEVRVYNRNLSPLEINYLHTQGNPDIDVATYREFRVMTDPDLLAARESLREVAEEHNQLYSWLPEIMVMGDDPFADPMRVKKRGVYTDLGEEVDAQAFDQIFSWDESLPNDRMGLAQWLFDSDNPLTSRVYANRLWQSIFGRGLVETAEDFGTQGAIPSHPELLDWLAAELMESGWDTRHMLKLMVMSETYQQDSRVSEMEKERDPFNRLLSRGVRLRHSAEVIRDSALFASGLFQNEVGGPSVRPYQPEGVWLAVSVNQPVDYPMADQVPLDEHHRRTMYGYVKRASQHPALQVFDFPQRITSIARRRTSNTPLQALVLLNDQQYLEAYEGMAYRAIEESDDLTEQINHIYKLALRRDPVSQELEILRNHYNRSFQRFSEDSVRAENYLSAGLVVFPFEEEQLAQFAALASTARIVMNSPDAYTRH